MTDLTQREQWIENNCPKENEFSRGFVKYLMKLAYDEGRKVNDRIREEDEFEKKHGPRFI